MIPLYSLHFSPPTSLIEDIASSTDTLQRVLVKRPKIILYQNSRKQTANTQGTLFVRKTEFNPLFEQGFSILLCVFVVLWSF